MIGSGHLLTAVERHFDAPIPSARDETHNGLPGGLLMLDAFLPVVRMRDRGGLAREESDAAYFLELLYLGEMVVKLLVVELLAGMQDDRESHRYGLEYRLVRADGLGEWADILDSALAGPASQHLLPSVRDSQQQLGIGLGPGADGWQRRAVDLLNQACRCLDGDFEDVSRSKTSMRTWVRHFAWLRNRTRGHGSPKAATLSTICPELELSIVEIVDNAPAFQRTWVNLRRNLSGKYRVSGFGGNREDFAYLTREGEHSLPNGPYVYLGCPRAATLLFTDAELTDFFLPNGNYRNGQFEAVSYITDDRRTEDGAAYTLPPGAQPASETAATPDLDLIGSVFTNLPPKRDGYISRSALEAELTSHLTDSRHPVVTLQGRGGVGKTSLALEVLHDLAKTDNFYAIIWFSARDIDLLPEGPRVVKADVLSREDVARDFADLMDPDSKSKLFVAQQYLTDCLSGKSKDGPFVFVFDNFETFREQSSLYAYVSNAVRLPNKVLITTRSRDFKADYPIKVGGLERTEYHALVAEVSVRLGIVNLIDRGYEDELYVESDGHPYITKVLLGEAALTGSKVRLKRVVATKEGVLDALFDRSYVALSPGAQRVFLTLCSWRSMVPRIGIEAVLMRPDNERLDVGRAMAELRQASLVEEIEGEGVGDVFLSVPLAAALFGKRKLVTSPLKIAIDADMELVRGFGAVSLTQVSNGLAPRLERLTRSVAHRAERNHDLTQEIAVIEYIATEYPPAWLNLATLQQEMGDKVRAIESVNRYLESRPKDQEAWGRLVILYRSVEDVLGEMHARLQLAELTRPPFNELSTAASRLNGLLSRGEIELGKDERRLMVSKIRQLIEDRHDEADATDLSRLAWICMYDHDKTAAEHWAQEGLRLDPNNEHCLRLMRRVAE